MCEFPLTLEGTPSNKIDTTLLMRSKVDLIRKTSIRLEDGQTLAVLV